MPNVRQTMKEQMQSDVLAVIQQHGVISYNEIAQTLGISYWTARNYVSSLLAENRVVIAKKAGTTVYFAPSGQNVIPSIPNKEGGMTSFNNFIGEMNQRDNVLAINQFSKFLGQAVAIIYAQPLQASISGSYNESDMAKAKQIIIELIQHLEYRIQVLNTILERVYTEDADILAAWARDPNYNSEIALQTIIKYYKDNAGTYSDILKYYKEGPPVDAD